MARLYKETTKEKFLKDVQLLLEPDSGNDDYDGEYFPENMSKALNGDFKVEFDWENYTQFGEFSDGENNEHYIEGHRELVPGFHTYWMFVGGDWEHPVAFVLYNSDKGIRAYIPKDGNVWDHEEKCAYMGDEWGKHKIDNDAMIKDVLIRIKKK